MAMNPTTDPSVAAAITPALEAGKQIAVSVHAQREAQLCYLKHTLLNTLVFGGVKIEFLLCTHK